MAIHADAVRGARNDQPAGILRIDRAAHDLMGSSEAAFYQAALLLRTAFSAAAAGADIENRLGQRLIGILADQAG